MNAGSQPCDRPCPICGSALAREVLTWQTWRINRCKTCAMVYLCNPVSYELQATTCAWSATFAAESRLRREREPVLHAVQQVTRPLVNKLRRDKVGSLFRAYGMGGRILDVGCGNGRRLMSKLPPGATPLGIEIDPDSAAKADLAFRRHAGQCWCAPACDVLRQFEDASIDCSLLHAYLEHEVQPGAVLRELARVLRPPGPVIIKVPNHASINRLVRGRRWCGYRFPDHVNYFTPATLRALLEGCGFRIVQSRFTDHLPFSDNLWMVARRQQ